MVLMSKIRGFFGDKEQLSGATMEEMARDQHGLPSLDPGPEAIIAACTKWLTTAQDRSASNDGGVARDFSLQKGWAASYPETTGYIVPTILEVARSTGDSVLLERGRRMLDWLVSIQFPEGGFQGGKVFDLPKVPVTFNTGQILIGLAAGVSVFGDVYREPMIKAAVWLRDSLDTDGCWRKYATPFAAPGDKAYETHVSWGLFEAARHLPDQGFAEAGLRQVRWAMTKQTSSGWFDSCCLVDPKAPLTHTLGYVLRGIIEGFIFSKEADLLESAKRLAEGLLVAQRPDGSLPGRLHSDWSPAVKWSCLTGNVQIAHCWFLLYQILDNPLFLEAGKKANAYVRKTIRIDGPEEVCGGVKGSFPVDGHYGRFEFLNWAGKFTIDANLIEIDLRRVSHA